MSITVRNVCHDYNGKSVLRGVSTSFPTGKFSAIVGPNGCGKTTLFNLISGVLPLVSGSVDIGGKFITDYDKKDLAKTLSVLTQSMHAPEFMTVHDMVMQGRYCHQSFLSRYSDADLKIVENALNTMSVDELAGCYLSQLSGGQLQRCRMAMLLAQETDIIMLDEPTSHLDLYHQYALLDTARALVNAGKTVVSILHDMTQTSLYADMVTVLCDGGVYASGSASDTITTTMMKDVFGVNVQNISKTGAIAYVPEHIA